MLILLEKANRRYSKPFATIMLIIVNVLIWICCAFFDNSYFTKFTFIPSGYTLKNAIFYMFIHAGHRTY